MLRVLVQGADRGLQATAVASVASRASVRRVSRLSAGLSARHLVAGRRDLKRAAPAPASRCCQLAVEAVDAVCSERLRKAAEDRPAAYSSRLFLRASIAVCAYAGGRG